MYLRILACKYQEFLGNRHLLCLFQSKYSIYICTRFCCLFYHSYDLLLHLCCWLDHSQNSCHKQLELFILLVQESMVTSQTFRSNSFFRFLTQCSVPDKGRDLLKDILSKKMIRKLNLILLLIVR